MRWDQKFTVLHNWQWVTTVHVSLSLPQSARSKKYPKHQEMGNCSYSTKIKVDTRNGVCTIVKESKEAIILLSSLDSVHQQHSTTFSFDTWCYCRYFLLFLLMFLLMVYPILLVQISCFQNSWHTLLYTMHQIYYNRIWM